MTRADDLAFCRERFGGIVRRRRDKLASNYMRTLLNWSSHYRTTINVVRQAVCDVPRAGCHQSVRSKVTSSSVVKQPCVPIKPTTRPGCAHRRDIESTCSLSSANEPDNKRSRTVLSTGLEQCSIERVPGRGQWRSSGRHFKSTMKMKPLNRREINSTTAISSKGLFKICRTELHFCLVAIVE